jgi:heptosyltransferase-1
MNDLHILVVRLGAMGDIIHALPAVASLKHSFPGARVTWVVEPRWAPLLEANPFVDRVTPLRRGTARGILESWREIRCERYEFAVDFQGLIKSAATAACARPTRIFGFHRSQAREPAAALFYSDEVRSASEHVVDRNLDLAVAAGATAALRVFPLPPGAPEGELPHADFVLASPLAGWRRKQWPLAYYGALAARLRAELGMALVLDGPESASAELAEVAGAQRHFSGLPGLIDATRRAAAVVGVDSGPMHLAAALGRPGVAIFGPTDPARNGPYASKMRVLRSPLAVTTYKRSEEIDSSMRQISPDEVFESLRASLGGAAERRP